MKLGNVFRFFHSYLQESRSLLKSEKETIYSFCGKIFSIIAKITVGIFIVMVTVATPFFDAKYVSLYAYSLFVSLALAVGFSVSNRKNGKYILPLMYLFAFFLYAFAIFVSLMKNSDHSHVSATFMCLQIILPLLIFDNPIRIALLVVSFFLFHSALSYHFKDFYDFVLDFFTGAAFTVVGIIIGEYDRYIRLRGFATDRILIYQKNTDMLTNLPNRWSLYERLTDIEAHHGELSGLFMIDIDHFKLFNDTYGHQAGDDCLRRLGAYFAEWGEAHGFAFYRYGGEEFIGMTAKDTYDELKTHAEELRAAVQALSMSFAENEHGVVTISVGYAPHYYTQSYEKTIKAADDALYTAKNAGRNRVYGSK